MAVVVPVAAIFGSAGVASASGLTVAQPDGSGNYAVCNVDLSPVSVMYSDSQTNLPLYGSGWGAYFKAFSVSAYCNTAWPQVGGQSMVLTMWYGTTGAKGSASDVGCDQSSTGGCTWAADGHVTVSCTTASPSDHCGGGTIGCIDASYYASSSYTGLPGWEQASADPYNCSTAVVHCDTQPTSAGWTSTYGYTGGGGVQPCSATYSLTGGTAVEPGTYWGTQAVVLPTVGAPVVTCKVTVNAVTGVASLTATATDPSGASGVAYQWDYGDSSPDGTALAETHSYTAGDQPPGGFVAVFTATATGDGVTANGTASASCTKSVDLTAAGSGAGGGTAPSGGTAPPSSCSFFDLICSVESAVAWLVVPSAGFFSSWSTFEGTMKTAIPFSYVVDGIAWGYNLESQISSDLAGYGGAATCWDIHFASGASACATVPSTYANVIQVVVSIALISGFALGVVALARRTLGEH